MSTTSCWELGYGAQRAGESQPCFLCTPEKATKRIPLPENALAVTAVHSRFDHLNSCSQWLTVQEGLCHSILTSSLSARYFMQTMERTSPEVKQELQMSISAGVIYVTLHPVVPKERLIVTGFLTSPPFQFIFLLVAGQCRTALNTGFPCPM